MNRIECGKCGKRFPDMIKLSKHIRTAHKGEVVTAVVHQKEGTS
jgi:hypothetical protein